MKFSIGDLVVEKKDLRPNTSYNVHKIVSFLDESLLCNHFGFGFDGEITSESSSLPVRGTRSWRANIVRLEENEVCTTEEALTEIHNLEAAKSKIEAEFESMRDLVKTNIDQATAFIKNANEILKPHNKTFFDLSTECSELFIALDDGGWSHSTMKCRYGNWKQ